MKKIKIFAVSLILSVIFVVSGLAQGNGSVGAKFDEYMNAAVEQGFTGAVLVAHDGQVVYRKGFGMANLELGVPNTPQTVFRLGSVTKQYTAAAILVLQERGKLSVEDPVCKYVSECPSAWGPITIHHLLTHTSGIPNYTEVKSPEEFRKMGLMPVTVTGFIETFKNRPLEFAVGEKWKYSNSGYYLLGYIIEKVSNQSYEAFLQENIFGPLKLTNTGYDRFDRLIRNRATGYAKKNDKVVNSDYLDMTVPYSAGALYSTVEDLFAWNEALFGDKLLSAKSRELMITPVKNDYAYGLAVNR